jgi:hypothetical protein
MQSYNVPILQAGCLNFGSAPQTGPTRSGYSLVACWRGQFYDKPQGYCQFFELKMWP